jgi:hypothetical protein
MAMSPVAAPKMRPAPLTPSTVHGTADLLPAEIRDVEDVSSEMGSDDRVEPGSRCSGDAVLGEARLRTGIGTSALTGSVLGDVGLPALGGSCAQARAIDSEEAMASPSATERRVAARLWAGNRLAMTMGDAAAN